MSTKIIVIFNFHQNKQLLNKK